MGFIIQKVLLNLILPPAGPLLLILSGLMLLRWRRTAGRLLLAIGIIPLYALSLDPVADKFIRPLEAAYKPLSGAMTELDAIVVLGGGIKDLGWVPASPEPSGTSIERLAAGIGLAMKMRLPLVITGGSGEIIPGRPREADSMADMAEKLGLPRKDIVVENISRNTLESAEAVAKLIPKRTIVLVTSAFHMKRAAGIFRKQGFTVLPAPAGYFSQSRPSSLTHLIPRAHALDVSSTAIAEYLSLAWYRATGKL